MIRKATDTDLHEEQYMNGDAWKLYPHENDILEDEDLEIPTYRNTVNILIDRNLHTIKKWAYSGTIVDRVQKNKPDLLATTIPDYFGNFKNTKNSALYVLEQLGWE